MSTPRVTVLLMLLTAVTSPLRAQAPATSAAITARDLMQRLYRIADDSMRGRDTGSPGDSLTADYVAAEFKRLGLQPAGEHGAWFQTVPFMRVVATSATIDVHDGTPLRAGTDFITIGRPTAAADASEFSVVFGGSANDSSTWISANDAADRVVVFDVRRDASGRVVFGAPALFNNPRFARARGIAVAALGVVDPPLQAALTRSRPSLDTTRGSVRPFQLLLTAGAASRMFATPFSSLKPGAPGKRTFTGNPAPRFAPLAYSARNVVAILPGRDPTVRGEYVSLTAHNDHVGICGAPVDHDSLRAFNRVYRPMGADTRTWSVTPENDAKVRHLLDSLRTVNPVRPDSICNGADDDGSGTVALLELAEYFASLPAPQRPRRSLLFVSHVAEELGLVGSAWYTDHPTVSMDSIVAEIDEDMIGRGRASDLPDAGPTYLEVVGLRRLSNEFGDVMEAANAAQPMPFVFNYQFDKPGDPLRYYCRADHYNYARYGVPSVALSRGEHLDYHQVTDEPQYIDYDDMARVVLLVRDATMRIANLDHPPKLDKPKGDPHARCVQ